MTDILRTRPIYALQGPPGTGKTTMVAYLLRQILKDDPVAQILITAQAHGAVDVLRAKVRDEAFVDVEETEQPLAIRLRRVADAGEILEGSVEDVALHILRTSIDRLEKIGSLNSIQQSWREYAQDMVGTISSLSTGQDAPEFCELVRRGANITYCTTSAGDLEELARSTQFYDWAIIEEAGKCHGFDLALPLQAGHRWLLIGDQYQLPPYRFEDYKKALLNLERVVEALEDLPNRAAGLLDFEWVRRWDAMNEDEQFRFKKFAREWLNTFEHIFENCRYAPTGSSLEGKLTSDKTVGAGAGMLSRQYRMHPGIGTLISEAYYRGEIRNQTINEKGEPLDRVIFPIASPEAIRGKGIVWLDTPAASRDERARELGPIDGKPRYTNPYEAQAIRGFLTQLELEPSYLIKLKSGPTQEQLLKLAILSPYNQQVSLIRQILSGIQLPEGLVLKEELRTSRTETIPTKPRLAHTVDSFQGNEADIILVSLVRNNRGEHGRALGFLERWRRMNVLLSRAQRLLVLVGSWEFFSEQVAPFSLEDPTREEWHLKKVISMLEGWFSSGEAIRLDACSFAEVQ
jgi:superfamily I DNA and/or RNA helicase